MGYGDEIMVSSIAKRIYAMTNNRVRVMGINGEPRMSDIWAGLDYLTPSWEAHARIINGPGHRHYYSGMEGNRILWRKWDIAPGEIRLTDEERGWAREDVWWHYDDKNIALLEPFIVVEPKYKRSGGGGANKDWGAKNWNNLVVTLREDATFPVNLIELGQEPLLPTVFPVATPTFRHACAILERSIGYVGHEGGLHHAAAALDKPATVVFGGYISPDVTGYAGHKNLFTPDRRYPLGCGFVTPCEHCREAMNKITVEQVVNAVKEMVS